MPTVKRASETQLVAACLDWLAVHRIMAWRNNTQGVYDPVRKKFRTFTGRKGVADILGVLPGGRALAVECKMVGNKPTPDQVSFGIEFVGMGGLYVLAYSIDDLAKAVKL